MATHKPFRELVKPGTNFDFIGRAKLFTTIALLGVIATIAMLFVNKSWRGDYLNWSTDFKGGTEITFAFHKKGTDQPVEVSPGTVRSALGKAGFETFEVADITWKEETSQGTVDAVGILVRTADFGAVPAQTQDEVKDAIAKEMPAIEAIGVSWSEIGCSSVQERGRLEADAGAPGQAGPESAPLGEAGGRRGPCGRGGDRRAQGRVHGRGNRGPLPRRPGQGAGHRDRRPRGQRLRRGRQGRRQAAQRRRHLAVLRPAAGRAVLVVRFDLRYAPGAIRALLLDATIVVGVFAVTWTKFSLVTVAAILTVIGYSVNDTVVIYDRIRENMVLLKDKKLSRIMNISVNEMLGRTLLTNMTVFAVTLMMNIFGSGDVRNFAFAMNIAAVVGTYSSLFIAAPLALWIHTVFYEKRGKGPARASRTATRDESEIDEADGDDGEGRV